MIWLDTNVASAFIDASPNLEVSHWLAEQSLSSLFVSSVTLYEISFGIERLPLGKKRAVLEGNFELFLRDGFQSSVLPIDQRVALNASRLMATMVRAGRTRSLADMLIAGTALAYDMALATRNIRDFEAAGLKLINPWDPTP